jgi:RHS repeat-associated protein
MTSERQASPSAQFCKRHSSQLLIAFIAGVISASLSAAAGGEASRSGRSARPVPAQGIAAEESIALRDLLAGRDARADIAEARAQSPIPQLRAADASVRPRAFGEFATGVQQVQQALSAAHAAWRPDERRRAHAHLVDVLAQVHARKLLLDARVEQIDRLVGTVGMPSVARSRWQSHRAALTEIAARFDTASQDALGTLASASPGALPTFADLEELVATELHESAPAVYGANLPVFRPRLAVRDPLVTPVVVPSYADAAHDDVPLAVDFAASDDAPLSASILQAAATLGYDYTRIFDFVRSQVHTQWYAGAQKGAQETLRTMAGNDVDQASLLIALLRASGAPARYVRGVADVPVHDLASMLGVRDDEVGLALSAAGVPNRALVSAGHISGFAIEQVYVSAFLPFSNYRGTAADLDGRTWIPLAPALKPYTLIPAGGALTRTGIAVDGFVQQYLSSVQTVLPLDLLRQQTNDRLAALTPPMSYESQLAKLDIDAPPLGLLPASLPVPIEAVTGEFAVLPDALHQHARIVVHAGAEATAPIVLDHSFALPQLTNHRVTLAYQPASIDDGRIADQNHGIGGTPPYLIHVRPVVNVAGMPGVVGNGELENGALHRIEITLDNPAGSAVLAQQVTAGGVAAIVFDAQNSAPMAQAETEVLPGESETKAVRLLANFGATYFAAWDEADKELANLLGVGIVRPFPSVALVINQYRVDRVGGVADTMVWNGVALDAALRAVEPFPQADAPTAAADWLVLTSLEGSALEHSVFEQQWSVDSISADRGLGVAAAQNMPVLTLTRATGTAGVNQSQAVRDAIAQWLSQGYVVDVPHDPITYRYWRGAVWRVRSLSSGEAGYFISGGLAGGSTAMPPELWYLQDLVQLLGNPYGEDPDEDPQSGVAISLDANAQYQEGRADTDLPKALRAIVIDAQGRPVSGASVTFAITQGSATLTGGASKATVLTDRNGAASVRIHLGQKQGDFGEFRVTPGQTYPQWVGHNTIEVSAAAQVGRLYAGQPYLAFTLPNTPSKVKLLGDATKPLAPGMSYNGYQLAVRDAFDNEISNVAAQVTASTQYKPLSCGSDGTQIDTFDATLFAPGQCPFDQVQLTGNTCATPSLSVMTRPGGAPFFVVPPKTALAKVTVLASAAGATDTLQLSTDPLYDPCLGDKVLSVTDWLYTLQYGRTPLLAQYDVDVLVAAAPGALAPEPLRADAYEAKLVRGSNAGVEWHAVTNATLQPHIQNGDIENVRNFGNGTYLADIRAGADPGPVHGGILFFWNDNTSVKLPGAHTNTLDPSDLVYGWSVAMHAPAVQPSVIPLTPFGATDATIRVESKSAPSGYIAAPLQIELLQGEEVIDSASIAFFRLGEFFAEYGRGILIDRSKSYSARMVINDGTPFRMESARTPLVFGQGIVGGYGIVPHASVSVTMPETSNRTDNSVLDELALVQGRYPKSLNLFDSVDTASGYSCIASKHFGFVLAQPANVSLVFHQLDQQGNVSPIVAFTALDHVAETQGLHDLAIASNALPIGDYQYELKAIAGDGTVETYIGVAAHHSAREDSLPLAHPFVKGVDLFSGGAVLSEEDIAIGGRGPGMKLTRTYASHQGDKHTAFGRGWASDLDMQVKTDECDTRVVTGAAGQGQRFKPLPADPDGTVRFTALHGYHGTLVQKGAEYDLYAKDGMRYHFGQTDMAGPRVSYIEDTNGNRVAYDYEVNQGAPRITRIEDAAGRHIDLAYEVKQVSTQQSGITVDDQFTVVTSVRGPGNLQLVYGYDDQANLTAVTRTDGTLGDCSLEYGYTDLGGLFVVQPDGEFKYYRFGWRLKTAKNASDGGVRAYGYELGWAAVINLEDGKVQYVPEQRTESVTEPDGGTTRFAYLQPPSARGLTPVATEVTDADAHLPTHFDMNRYGAAVRVTDFAGTTQTEWDMTHLEPHIVTDALGTLATYVYDDAGNKTSEIIAGTAGTISRSWSYKSPSEFSAPFIRDRVAIARDGNGNDTTYGYDSRGNRTSTLRFGINDHDGYDPNGDHATHTDGLGHLWQWRYDANGYPRETETPLHFVAKTTYDDRGRKRDETDANGHQTVYTYDARDRVLTTTYPVTELGQGVARSAYDDAADTRTDTNPNNHATISTFDKMGRLTNVRHADGHSRSLTYDFNGNLTDESDFTGNHTGYKYDDANRRIEIDAPEGRTTQTEYDALGHVTKEAVGESPDDRVTEYEYKHPLYKRTLVRRHLDATRNAEQSIEYDSNGNAKGIVDPAKRATTRRYDARDRMVEEVAPYGKTTLIDYDDDDRPVTQTVKNPGHADQVTTFDYDADGRQTSIKDAEADTRTTGYDHATNVTSRTDARGNFTHYEYNARDQLITERGPETGQLTTYVNDLTGNRVSETWSNGNTRASQYDLRERRMQTTDAAGLVESFTYTPDDQIETRTDANGDGHTTANHYDGLHRLKQQDLPTVPAGPRSLFKTYNVHGDVRTETDAESHLTTHEYDHLGRRVSTTQPTTDDGEAVLIFDYDLVDRMTMRENARHQTTRIEYDDTTHTTTQTDPTAPGGTFTQVWTYDALGNEVRHVDRCHIATDTHYDRVNRPTTITRNGLDTVTRVYVKGLLDTETDANQHTTQYHYDLAGRKDKEDRPGATRRWTYWPMGDVHTATDADGSTTTYTYTPRRYLESESLFGETTLYTYDGEGHRTTMQRPRGADWTWSYAYDPGDRLISVKDPQQHETTFAYDRDGNQTGVTNANLHTTTYGYDARHHRRTLTYQPITHGAAGAGAASVSWHYDIDGNIASEATANGNTLSYSVDALNRVTDETVVSPDPVEIAHVHTGYDGNGNVTQVTETLGTAPPRTWCANTSRTSARTYDPFDRLETLTDICGRSLRYGYDPVGNRTSVSDTTTIPAQEITRWSYNALNQNDGVTVDNAHTTIDTFPSGKVHIVTRPDGSTSTTEYDAAGRIASITHAKDGQEVAYLGYRYDANGNRIQQDERNGPLTSGTRSTAYTYDTSDWLTQTATPERITTYLLDATGNRTDEQIVDANQHLISHSTLNYNEREQLYRRDDALTHLTVDLTYDPDGNTVTETDNTTSRTYRYDAHDRLLRLNPGTPITFDYDSTGLRIAKQVNGGSGTGYQYDGQSLLEESNLLGNPLARYHYSATELISRTDTTHTATRHYLSDALHTPIATQTSTGIVDSRTQYDAWGEITKQQAQDPNGSGTVFTPSTDATYAELPSYDQQDIGFTGYIKDTETGLYYVKARYYDPRIARFTTQDPEEGKAMEPPSLHRYLYAYANPEVYTDPTGREQIPQEIRLLQQASWTKDPEQRARLIAQSRAIDAEKSHAFLHAAGATLAVYDLVKDSLVGTAGLALTGAALQAEDFSFGKINLGAHDLVAAQASKGREFLSDHPIERLQQATADTLYDASQLDKADPIKAARMDVRLGGDYVAAATGIYGLARQAAAGAGNLASKIGAFDAAAIASEDAPAAARASADARKASGITPSNLQAPSEASGPKIGAADPMIVAEEEGPRSGTALQVGVKLELNLNKSDFSPEEIAWINYKYQVGELRSLSGAETSRVGENVPYQYHLSRRFARDELVPGVPINKIRINEVAPGQNVDEFVSRHLGGRQVPENQNFAPKRANQILGPIEYRATKDLPKGTPVWGFNVKWNE